MPALIVVISVISAASQDQLKNKITEATKESKLIVIVDDSKIINPLAPQIKDQPQIKLSSNINEGIDLVKQGKADVAIHYPADLSQKLTVEIYAKDDGILSEGKYNDFATNLIKQNILSEIKDPQKLTVFNSSYNFQQHLYKDGTESEGGFAKYIIPIVSVILYFLFTSFASNYLLMSVSEEKENRMIEIILSSVKARDLIWGKVIGLVGVILTQIVMLVVFAVVAFSITGNSLPFQLGDIKINPVQMIIAFIYLMAGFLILANTMVGCGAAMPTFRDAQGFSTIFIMLSILPIYGFAFIIADPNGILAYALSYFPYTAPIILLLRNALGVIGPIEVIISAIVLAVYVVLTGIMAYKLFEFGALEYNQKISFKSFFKTIRKKN
jgi:ABC-2 type transport system permease protein